MVILNKLFVVVVIIIIILHLIKICFETFYTGMALSIAFISVSSYRIHFADKNKDL